MVTRPTGYLNEEELAALRRVSTATLTTQLYKRGIKTAFMEGVRPLRPDLRLVGYAYTLRYIPAREDLGDTAEFDNWTNPQRLAVEEVGAGDVLVIDARGELGAGVLGDILVSRIHQRGAAGIVTDGCFRDSPGVAGVKLPTYARGMHAYMSAIIHHPVETNRPVGCGGVAVIPGDVIVGDAEGIVVLPREMAAGIARDALSQELYEAWALRKIQAGSSIRGVYPPDDSTRAEYEQWLREQGE